MLDRGKLAQELEIVARDIFLDTSQENSLIHALWQQLSNDPLLKEKIAGARVSWSLPTWQENINEMIAIRPIEQHYDLIAVDGSQIYPDRHMGVSCYVINIGEVVFRYGLERPVVFYTKPYVFSGNEDEDIAFSAELINGKRQDIELVAGLQRVRDVKSEKRKHLLLFDGSLIFWHLEAKDVVLKEIFLSRYLTTLRTMQQEQTVCASYISAPKSKELINVIKAYGSDFDEKNQGKVAILARYTDDRLLKNIMQEGERTIIFKNHAKISELYPPQLHPHFFYLHVGAEIGRVEIPAWIAQDKVLVDWIASSILDQCIKGGGYPVALAEAHEQAVIKGADREFFYHLIQKMNVDRYRTLTLSQKIIKKRAMGI